MTLNSTAILTASPDSHGHSGVADNQTFAMLALVKTVEATSAFVLAADVAVVFASVVWRYFLHDPLHWAEEVARSLMMLLVFLGATVSLVRGKHASIDVLRKLLPVPMQLVVSATCPWILVAVASVLTFSAGLLVKATFNQTTPLGLPQIMFIGPVLIGGLLLFIVSLSQALRQSGRLMGAALVGAAMLLLWIAMETKLPGLSKPAYWLVAGFIYCLVAGAPIAFALAFAAMVYFLLDPSLPIVFYSQQIAAGADHFVLLAIPFFVLAGVLMEVNGMSARLIELLVRLFGRMRGGLNIIMIGAMAFFSGISGSKLADVAAVGGILMPAVRRCEQDEDDAAALLASSAVMAETIPPCINLIIFGFVANVSIGGLFVAGLVPAAFMALCLMGVAIWFGQRADPDRAFPNRRAWPSLIFGALVGLVMILMIGKGVMSGVATSTEVSAFAVVYALIVGGLAFRELTWRNLYKLFVDSAALSGMILLIVAAASSVAFALTIEQIPQALTGTMVELGRTQGAWVFILVSICLLIVFGSVLEGAPALIIFGPLLTPIAAQLGIHPLHFGIVLVISMGLGLFAPPLGLGLYTTCAIAGTTVEKVTKPMLKYLAVLLVGLILLAMFPSLTLWLPNRLGFA